MAHNTEILEYLEHWESKRFRPSEITFAEAAASLATDSPLVVAKPGVNNSRWIMMNRETDKVAVMVFTGIWKWGGDLQTGNFVPAGKQAPDGIPSDRIQDTPSFKCELTYTFDTSVDGSLWEYLKVFEEHVCAQQDFNKGKRPRRQWQNGKNPLGREAYIVSSRIFTRRSPFNSKSGSEPSVPYTVHPWISKAVKDFTDTKQIPNPERPRYYDYIDGVLRNLEETTEPRFNRNDIVWMSCKLGFVVTGDSWWPEIIPLELIRVDKLPQIETSKSDASLYPSLGEDFTPLELGEPLQLFDEPTQSAKSMKRKDRVSEEPVTTPNKRAAINTVASPEPQQQGPESQEPGRQEPERQEPERPEPERPEPELRVDKTPARQPLTDTTNRPKLRSKSTRENRTTRA